MALDLGKASLRAKSTNTLSAGTIVFQFPFDAAREKQELLSILDRKHCTPYVEKVHCSKLGKSRAALVLVKGSKEPLRSRASISGGKFSAGHSTEFRAQTNKIESLVGAGCLFPAVKNTRANSAEIKCLPGKHCHAFLYIAREMPRSAHDTPRAASHRQREICPLKSTSSKTSFLRV